MPIYGSSSTNSTIYYNNSTSWPMSSCEDSVEPKTMSKPTFHSKPMERIVGTNTLKGSIVIFGHRRSPVSKDIDALHRRNIDAFYTDPIKPEYAASPSLHHYDFAVIIDALEYIPGMMAKANLIKEALLTLNPERSNACVIMVSKTPKMVNEFVKKHKCEKTENGFLMPETFPFGGLHMNGIEAEELIVTAHFAGAHLAEVASDVETDMTCVRAYSNNKKQKKSNLWVGKSHSNYG